jgi:phosphatidylglycerol:prolipoprotein diacylglycerol transferase
MALLIEIDIDPVIAHIGPFALRWYSLMIMLGVLAGTWLAAKFAERRGIAADHIYSAALWVVIGGMAGARLAHVVDRFDFYLANPAKILAIHEGGIAIWGGLIAGGLAGTAYALRHKLPFWPFADAASHAAILGQAIGRIGCIVNGDVAGKPTNGNWGFVYTNPNALLPKAEYFNTPTHPYPLYELVWDLALFGLLFVVARKVKFDGAVFLTYCALYSLGRFLLTFTREEAVFLFGLQQAQVFSIIVIIVAAYLYLYRRAQQGRVPAGQPAGPAEPAQAGPGVAR